MNPYEVLTAALKMAADDNQGVKMSTTITDVRDDPLGSIVSFGVEKETGDEARKELFGATGKYMVCCFFIDREELQKYKE